MSLLATGITAGAALAGQGANMAFQGNMNKKTRAFSREMYDKQRQHAIQDFNLKNSYDHPSSQMARLREAGLNPNLVYGNGTVTGNSSSGIDQAKAPAWNPDAPKLDLGEVAGQTINTYNDLRMKGAQYDNLKAQNTETMERTLLLKAQRDQVIANTAQTNLDYNINSKYSADMRDALLQKSIMDIRLAERQDYKYMLENKFADDSFDDRRLQIKTGNKLRSNQADLQKLELNLREMGINPNDPIYMRIIGQALQGNFSTFKKFLK